MRLGSWPLIVVKMRLETWLPVVGEAWVLASCPSAYSLQFCASGSLQVFVYEAWVLASCRLC